MTLYVCLVGGGVFPGGEGGGDPNLHRWYLVDCFFLGLLLVLHFLIVFLGCLFNWFSRYFFHLDGLYFLMIAR